MADAGRERWKRLVADFEPCDLTRESATERGLSFNHPRHWIYRLLFPTLFHRLSVTISHRPEVAASRFRRCGGRS